VQSALAVPEAVKPLDSLRPIPPGGLVTDRQVRRMFALVNTEENQAIAAAKAGMDAKTARKYRRLGHVPSELPALARWEGLHIPYGCQDAQPLLQPFGG
jgi:hypothetical protein